MANLPNLLFSFIFLLGAFITVSLRLFFPYHRMMSFSCFLIASIFTGLSYFYNRQYFIHAESLVKSLLHNYFLYVLAFLGLILFLYVFFTLIPIRSDLNKVNPSELASSFERDTQVLLFLDKANQALIEEFKLKKLASIQGDELIQKQEGILTFWGAYINNMIEIDLIKNRYKGFPHLSLIKRQDEHTKAFTLAYASFVSQYSSVLSIVKEVDDNEQLIILLNSEQPKYAIPGKAYGFLENKLFQAETLLKLNSGKIYFNLLKKDLQTKQDQELSKLIQEGLSIVQDSVFEDYPKIIAKKPLKFFERHSFEYWFPIQKNVALQLSYIHPPNREYIIKPEDILIFKDKLQAGDIFLERREWHATNAGIPGYWTHAALYLGSLEELDTYFTDLPELNGQSFSAYLAEINPSAYEAFQLEAEPELRVIEALRPGVILNSLEETANCDSISVLRVKNISRSEQFQVVITALSNLGKPYDYTFNFINENALVCSELVYKSYLDLDKLSLRLDDLNGALVYSPNNFAQKFAEEYKQSNSELELILFLDGNDKSKQAFIKNAEDFAQSYQRPKWHTLKDYFPKN